MLGGGGEGGVQCWVEVVRVVSIFRTGFICLLVYISVLLFKKNSSTCSFIYSYVHSFIHMFIYSFLYILPVFMTVQPTPCLHPFIPIGSRFKFLLSFFLS